MSIKHFATMQKNIPHYTIVYFQKKKGGEGPGSSSQPSLMKNYNAKECTDTVDVIHIYYYVDRHTVQCIPVLYSYVVVVDS